MKFRWARLGVHMRLTVQTDRQGARRSTWFVHGMGYLDIHICRSAWRDADLSDRQDTSRTLDSLGLGVPCLGCPPAVE